MEQIEHSFGATLPGLYSPSTDDYILYFRGVSFYFPVSKCQVNFVFILNFKLKKELKKKKLKTVETIFSTTYSDDLT